MTVKNRLARKGWSWAVLPTKFKMYGHREDPSFLVRLDRPLQVIRQYGEGEVTLVPGPEGYRFLGTKQDSKSKWLAIIKMQGVAYGCPWADLMQSGEVLTA